MLFLLLYQWNCGSFGMAVLVASPEEHYFGDSSIAHYFYFDRSASRWLVCFALPTLNENNLSLAFEALNSKLE